MKTPGHNKCSGVSLIEVLVAVAIIAVASVGALSYQYHAAQRTQLAKAELTATRTCRLLLEDWKSNGGDEDYDPSDLELGFAATGQANVYKSDISNLPMYISLDWQDIDEDVEAGVTLRRIDVTIRWRQDRRDDTIRTNDPAFAMNTYVRRDQSGG